MPNKNGQRDARKGVLYIVGTGPGSLEHITPAARAAIAKSEIIVGYGTYLDLIRELLAGKEICLMRKLLSMDAGLRIPAPTRPAKVR